MQVNEFETMRQSLAGRWKLMIRFAVSIPPGEAVRWPTLAFDLLSVGSKTQSNQITVGTKNTFTQMPGLVIKF